MFKKIKDRIKKLEKKIETLEKKPIGEYYGEFSPTPIGLYCPNLPSGLFWWKFYEIEDEVDGNVKIEGYWHKRSDIIIYDEIYRTKKRTIEKRLGKEND